MKNTYKTKPKAYDAEIYVYFGMERDVLAERLLITKATTQNPQYHLTQMEYVNASKALARSMKALVSKDNS